MYVDRPWIPFLKGVQLPRFASLENSIDRDSVPTEDAYPLWTQKAFARSFPLDGFKFGFNEALWETVLALWRLRFDVNQEANRALWSDYVLAYLVSAEDVLPVLSCHI
jgi:hypothetical protein